MKMVIAVFIVKVRRQFSNGDDQNQATNQFFFVICEIEKTIHKWKWWSDTQLPR